VDYCNYQLVDQYDHSVLQSYWNQVCNTGYDSCSIERDRLNGQMGENRYFCSETFRDQNYNYSTPTYDETNYGDTTSGSCNDFDNDGYCDEDNGGQTLPTDSYDPNYDANSCSDNDQDGYCD